MINYRITRNEALRNKESGLLTHLILGLTATDDQDGTSTYMDTKMEINDPVRSWTPELVVSTKDTFRASIAQKMEARIAGKRGRKVKP